MAKAGNPVCHHARPSQSRSIVLQPIHQGPKGACHPGGIHQCQDRHIQRHSQFGRRRLAVETPHDALDQNAVRVPAAGIHTSTHVVHSRHPRVDVMHDGPACQFQPCRIQEIGPALEYPNAATLPNMPARQGCGQRGLALARGGCRYEQSGAIDSCPAAGRLMYSAWSLALAHRGAHVRPTYIARPMVAYVLATVYSLSVTLSNRTRRDTSWPMLRDAERLYSV